MKLIRYWVILSGAFALFAAVGASASVINFENAPSLGLHDNDPVTNQFASGYGVTFDGGYLEEAGDADAGPQGFGSKPYSDHRDTARPTASGVPGLGNWFLRSKDGLNYTGSTTNHVFLTVNYDNPVSQASGQIWDIDGNTKQGTEQWLVQAFSNGTKVTNLNDLSPLGTHTGKNSLNALPWKFDLNAGDATFDQIQIIFKGSKTHGVGLAFDNFSPSSLVITAVPGPGALWLFVFGLGLLGLGLASRCTRRAASNP